MLASLCYLRILKILFNYLLARVGPVKKKNKTIVGNDALKREEGIQLLLTLQYNLGLRLKLNYECIPWLGFPFTTCLEFPQKIV